MKIVVIIDDDQIARALLAECLSGDNWRVIEAEDGEAGFDLVLQHRPHAVVCDIRIPKRNGFKVCQMIREHPELARTRLIIHTCSRFPNDRTTALNFGADDYLMKPATPGELIASLSMTRGADTPTSARDASLQLHEELPRVTQLRFWGVRGSIPTPGVETVYYGGNTACVELRVGEQIIILDAGSGIRTLGTNLALEFAGRELKLTVLVSHTHWDHIQGFPFFAPAYNPKNSVRILGYSGAVHSLRGALFEQMQSAFFPVALNDMSSRIMFEELNDMRFELGPVSVDSFFANHPGICLSYRINTPAGSIVYLTDHEPYERLERETQKAEAKHAPLGITYARALDEKVIAHIRHADILIIDSQYDAAEYPARLRWGHTCVDDAVDLALRADIKHLFLFHHDPGHGDEKISEMVNHARSIVSNARKDLRVDAAREGLEIVLTMDKVIPGADIQGTEPLTEG